MAKFRTFRKEEQKLFSELFIWSLMTSDFASAEGKIRAHCASTGREPVIHWPVACLFNS